VATIDAPGAALVTLTKADDLLLTFTHRSAGGRPCVVLDPFGLAPGLSELVWDPIAGCVDPMVAGVGAHCGRVQHCRDRAHSARSAVAARHVQAPPPTCGDKSDCHLLVADCGRFCRHQDYCRRVLPNLRALSAPDSRMARGRSGLRLTSCIRDVAEGYYATVLAHALYSTHGRRMGCCLGSHRSNKSTTWPLAWNQRCIFRSPTAITIPPSLRLSYGSR